MGQRGNHKGNYKGAETNIKGNKTVQNLWDTAKPVLTSAESKVPRNTGLPLKTREVSGKPPHLKESYLNNLT